MRIVELSDHPGDMLRELDQRGRAAAQRAQLRSDDALARHRERVDRARRVRDAARAQRRWWAWLRAALAVRREQRQAPAAGQAVRPARDQAAILTAGVQGEQLAADGLSRALGEEWLLLRGYRNRRGEIDQLLLGPRGLFAIEVKHRNATVSCAGDQWWFEKFDQYGNRVDQGSLTDQRGRSPSRQLNEPASQLEEFLRSRGRPVAAQRVVLLTHPRSRLGNCRNPTVHIATSVDHVIGLLKASTATLTAGELAQLEQLIIRDHRHHNQRRRPDRPGRAARGA